MPGQPRPSTVLPWAAEGLFPATPQPWGAQPCKAVPGSDYFTPQILGQPIVPAEYLNQKFNDTVGATQQMQDWSGSAPALNWMPSFASTVFTANAIGQIQAVRWEGNPSVRQWLASVTYGTGTPPSVAALYTSADEGQTWSLAGGATLGSDSGGIAGQAAVVDPSSSGNYLAALGFTSAPLFQVNKAPFGGSWSNVYSASVNITAPVGACTSGSTAIFSYIVGGTGTLLSTNNGGTTWKTKTVGAPAEWLLRSSGTTVQQVLAMPLRTAKNTIGGYYVWDGITLAGGGGPNWQLQSLPTQMGNFDQVVGLTWATTPLGQCWVMCVIGWTSTGSAPIGPQFYVSGDGVEWFLLFASGPGVQFPPGSTVGYHTIQQGVQDIAAVGGLLIATGDPAGGQNGPSRIYVSVDGGVTWTDSQVTVPSNTSNSAVGWSRTRIAASDFGFFIGNSNWGRFSMAAGLPGSAY